MEGFEGVEGVEGENVSIMGMKIGGGCVDELGKEMVVGERRRLEEVNGGLKVGGSVRFGV
ncbi:hypothetical protein [Paenibacillus xylanexedens]|uniref:hypothetical protein n=1 Tax=Paenibacillus xylanexedens TaxID=528191 RepID=UPI0011AA8FCC|nr:hypothetical protein [Paenibacillus xylanexedens]